MDKNTMGKSSDMSHLTCVTKIQQNELIQSTAVSGVRLFPAAIHQSLCLTLHFTITYQGLSIILTVEPPSALAARARLS